MENRVYYGEYSLEHWIKLILKGNIKLPSYQRSFVWDKNKIRTLIETLKNKQFVPPVTIGAFNIDDENQNYILDGQQRLTSILLTYLGVFPKKDKFKFQNINYANENDDENDDEDESNDKMEWTFKEIVSLNKEGIKNITTNELYEKLSDIDVNDNFWSTTFLGFSYIVPNIKEKGKQQKFYSSVFRNINIQGQTLSVEESRKSLYYLDSTYNQFFETKVVKGLKVKQPTQPKDVDFIKYLALLSQYKKEGGSRLASGYSGKRGSKKDMETYYEDYIYSIVGERESNIFKKFGDIFPNGDFQSRFDKLKQGIDDLFDTMVFISIIDLDMYLFGLVYKVVFEDKQIDLTKKENLIKDLKKKINELKKNNYHTKSPASLKYLRSRVENSIKIYQKYEIKQSQ